MLSRKENPSAIPMAGPIDLVMATAPSPMDVQATAINAKRQTKPSHCAISGAPDPSAASHVTAAQIAVPNKKASQEAAEKISNREATWFSFRESLVNAVAQAVPLSSPPNTAVARITANHHA